MTANQTSKISPDLKGSLSLSLSLSHLFLSLSLSHKLCVYFQTPIFASGNLFLSKLAYT